MIDVDEKWRPPSEVAADWFVRLKDGHLTASERREYLQWLKKSPEHIAEMLQISRTYSALRGAFRSPPSEVLITDEEASNIIDFATRGIVPTERERRIRVRPWQIAAGFSMIMLASVLALIVKSAVFDRTIETGKGESKDVALADGSAVHLGPQTRLSLEFSDAQRLIYLESGEAYFDVAKDPGRPFIVNANPVDVRAVGTAFGVVRRDSKVTVTVEHGKVAVTPTARSGATGVVPLSAGEELSVSRDWPAVPRQVNVQVALAWKDGRLIFNPTVDTVGDAIRDFNRYNSVQIELDDKGLAAQPVGGVFEADDPGSFVETLEDAGKAIVVRDNQGVLKLEPRTDEIPENRGNTQRQGDQR